MQIKMGMLMLRSIMAPQKGMIIRKNSRFKILKLQPSQPHSGRCKRIEPGARMSMPPMIPEAIRMMVPKI